MENEVLTLYNTLSCYRNCIILKLGQIQDKITESVNNLKSTNASDQITTKYYAANEMLKALGNYVEMMHLCDKLLTEHNKAQFESANDRSLSQQLNDELTCTLDSDENITGNDQNEELDLLSETQTIINEPVLVDYKQEDIEQLDSDSVTDEEEQAAAVIETENKVPETVIKSDQNIEDSTPDCTVNKNKSVDDVPYSISRLLGRPVHDRWLEAQKKYEDKSLKREFKWKVVSPTKLMPSPKEKKKSNIYTILDDELKMGECCIFSHVVSPFEFYVHTNQQLFESLQNNINEELNKYCQRVVNKCKSKEEAKATFGNFCFCFLPMKRKWMRVEVIDWMDTDTDAILVQLIDYGDKHYCKYTNLHAMKESYAQFPRMAARCHLAAIRPPEDSKWPQWTVEKLIDLSEMKSQSKFAVIYANKEGASYAVDLVKKGEDNSISMILVAQGLLEQDVVDEEELSNEAFGDLDEEYENINEAITGYDAQDEARICPFTNSTGKCFKGARCKLEHGHLSRDGVTTDKVLVMTQTLVELDLPGVGHYIDILITGYISTCHFYAQIIRQRGDTSIYNQDFEMLCETMNSNNLVQTYETLKLYPGMGESVLVKDRGEWHRAICLTVTETDQIEVFLVDYGTKRLKKMKDLRLMKEDYLYTPFQAVECVLDGCREKSDINQEVSFNFFMECMYTKMFKAYVVDSSEPLKLYVWDMQSMGLDTILKNSGLGKDSAIDVFTPKELI